MSAASVRECICGCGLSWTLVKGAHKRRWAPGCPNYPAFLRKQMTAGKARWRAGKARQNGQSGRHCHVCAGLRHRVPAQGCPVCHLTP